MIKKLILTIFLVLLITPLAYAQYGGSLYADIKGREVGDILSIVIVESANASRGSKKKHQSSSEMQAGGSVSGDVFSLSPSLGFKSSGGSEFDGSESSQQSEKLTGRLSVQIVEITDNGLYRVAGERKVAVNGEENMMKIEGLVRSRDVSPANMVYSYNLADVQISYRKTGITNKMGQGFFSRLAGKVAAGLLLGAALGALAL